MVLAVAEVANIVLPEEPANLDSVMVTDYNTCCTPLNNKAFVKHPNTTHTIQRIAEPMSLNLPGRVYKATFYEGNWQISL